MSEETNNTKTKKSGRAVEIKTPGPVPPGETGQMAVEMTSSANLAGVTVEDGGRIVRILAGKEAFVLAEGQGWTDVLTPPVNRVLQGKFVTAIVENTTAEPKAFTGALFITDEVTMGQVVGSVLPNSARGAASGADPSAPPAVGTRGNPRVVTPSSQNAQEQMGSVHSPRTVGTPGAGTENRRRFGEQVGGGPAQSYVRRGAASVASGVGSPTTPVTRERLSSDLGLMIAPREDERAVALLRTHVRELLMAIQHGMMLGASTRAGLMLRLGPDTAVGTASAGSNEVVVVLPPAGIAALLDVASYRRSSVDDESERSAIVRALEEALEREARAAARPAVEIVQGREPSAISPQPSA